MMAVILNIFKIFGKGSIKTLYKRIDSIVSFYILITILVVAVLVTINIFFIKFWDSKGILIEAVGGVFDLIIFGILLAIFENKRQKQNTIKRFIEELEDYQGCSDKLAIYRVRGLFKRIGKNITSGLYLEDITIKDISYDEIDFKGIFFKDAQIKSAIFTLCSFTDTIFDCIDPIKKSHFLLCAFDNSVFKGCTLNYCSFHIYKEKDTNILFKSCKLLNCTFVNSGGLSVNLFEDVEKHSLVGTKFDDKETEKKFREKWPEAFKQPKMIVGKKK